VDKAADWRVILAQAKANLRMVSPVIARRMEQLSEWMEFSEWSSADFLPIVNDAHANQPLTEIDVPIQFAVRLSLGNNLAKQGPSRSKIRIKVIFNQKLFNLLDPIDQAILIFHEQLYALGQAVGLQDSDEIRPLVSIFFSNYFEDLRSRSNNGLKPVGLIPFFKDKLTRYFGDYAIFFSDLDVPDRGLAYSADRHFSVFVELINDLRKYMSECRGLGFSKDVCAEKSMFRLSMDPNLSEEKAFLFMTYFFLEKNLNAINSELIMDAELSLDEYKKALDFACLTLKEHAVQIEPSILAIKLALNYCR
jgi:hypothetical protein